LGIFLLSVVLVLFIVITINSQFYTPPPLIVLPLEETYIEAESIALSWQSDAQLNSADFNVELDDFPSQMNCNYTFLSPARYQYLLIFVKTYELGGYRANRNGYYLHWTEGDWPSDRPIGKAIIFDEIHLESNQALKKILEHGGNTFFERYHIRQEQPLLDSFNLDLERLDFYNGEGPLIWSSGFSVNRPHAQLYMGIEDLTGDLLYVKAYGEQEEEYWLRDSIIVGRIPTGQSKNYFDHFDLQVDKIFEENGRSYANFTIIFPKTPWLIYGEKSHTQVEPGSKFSFGDYDITVSKVDKEWVEFEVMPIIKWYKPKPEN